jgi:hypothetical protein
LVFTVLGARAERYAAAPMLTLRVGVTESTGAQIHAIALRTQVQLEPQLRRYGPTEAPRLIELFGPPERYGDTVRPMLWTHVAQMVLAFSGETEFDLTVPCSYDFDVAAHKYLSALEDGEIPLNLLFSGTIITRSDAGSASELVPWDREARYRLPVAVWREALDAFFPNSAWVRVSRDSFDELYRLKTALGLPTWDAVIARLCESEAAKT